MNHYLSIVLFLPLAGALLLLLVSKQNENAIRWIANVVAFLGFVVSIPLWFWFDPARPGFQFIERAPWIPSIGAEYFLGVDGFSTLLILLTTMMGSIAVLSSWTAITERVKEFYIFMLVLQTGMLGAFMALDFLLFFLFWEVMLVPMYFLIGIWGSDRRLYSAIKFFLYTLVGSVVMLLGILALYFAYHNAPANNGIYSFDITKFHEFKFDTSLQWWVFLAFFLGFAIKVPMFPFHTWLPDAHTDAPTAGSVILAAVLLKMGTYGFLRFSLPILPEASRQFVPMVVLLCIIGIVYGALVALAQRDWKRLVAYSSVSHMAMVMLGMFALNPVGITGSIVQQLNHGISTGALFLIVGIVYERRHTREISEYGGLSKVMPVYAAVFLIMTMSSIGLPALNGFIGEFLILQGVFVASKMWAAFAASGVVLGAAYMLYLYQRTMFGKVENPKNERLTDLTHREFATFAPLLILAVWIGLYPAPLLRRLETSVAHIMSRVNTDYAQAYALAADCGPLSPPASVAAATPPASTSAGATPASVAAATPPASTSAGATPASVAAAAARLSASGGPPANAAVPGQAGAPGTTSTSAFMAAAPCGPDGKPLPSTGSGQAPAGVRQ
ncbi:MAG TPA: NADH-quinone oxidoreductase subunit M [Vicinamibacterales bacterium]|jgi:NADH-quinone oxidoreductase subunit M|nr:NADH-quinone oxidoreductase subunit M [Vicinamibacterales bacterium]